MDLTSQSRGAIIYGEASKMRNSDGVGDMTSSFGKLLKKKRR